MRKLYFNTLRIALSSIFISCICILLCITLPINVNYSHLMSLLRHDYHTLNLFLDINILCYLCCPGFFFGKYFINQRKAGSYCPLVQRLQTCDTKLRITEKAMINGENND